jgi:hypothetical protein
MKKLTLALAMLVALAFAAQASAGGYAGSRFQKSDCTYTKTSNTLSCSALFTSSIPNSTATVYVDDPTCAGSQMRVFQRTGTLVETIRAEATFSGRVPLARNELFADEVPVSETWANYTDVDLGCLV